MPAKAIRCSLEAKSNVANRGFVSMSVIPIRTFIIDCPECRAKVAASETGHAERVLDGGEHSYPEVEKIVVGKCPQCEAILVGKSEQLAFAGYDSDEDVWGDVVRVYPNPPKVFSSARIPKVVKDSLNEAHLSFQAGAYTAACAMLGRALEAVCRDMLKPVSSDDEPLTSRPIERLMLGKGIEELHDKKIIDERLFKWSQQLHAFRNDAAHPHDINFSRADVEDLQTFVNAIIEYIYDLTDRYDELMERVKARTTTKKKKST